MRPNRVLVVALILVAAPVWLAADELPSGRGLTEENRERLVLDDMEDVSDWHNGSPDETVLSASDRHLRDGRRALLFANTVDHTKGEENYPIGWPRAGKDLARSQLSDWSGYDVFECWIYAETSRDRLPAKPLSVGFYHSGHKRSSAFPLADVRENTWVKVAIPVDQLLDAEDVQRIQFNISESDYRHGDRVDFYIDRPALVRYVEPAVAELDLERKLLFSTDRLFVARYKLVGYKGLEQTRAVLTIQHGEQTAASMDAKAVREGDLCLPIQSSLAPGDYAAQLDLRDDRGILVDRRQASFRVIAGPFAEE